MIELLSPDNYIRPDEYITASDETLPEAFTTHVVARRDGSMADQLETLTIVRPGQKTDVDIHTNPSDVICVTVHEGVGKLVVREYHEGDVQLTDHALKPGDQLGVGPDIQFYFEAGDDGLVVRDMRLHELQPETAE